MVDTEKVFERLKRGAYAGAGAFSAGLVKGELSERTDLGEFGLGGAQVAGGLALSVSTDMVFTDLDSVPNDVVEFAGYGMEAAGFADLGSEIANSTTTQTGAPASEVVEIEANAADDSTGIEQGEMSLDTA